MVALFFGNAECDGVTSLAARRPRRSPSLGRQEHYEPEVYGLVGEQAVGVVVVGQRQRQRRRVGRVVVEAVRRQLGPHARLAVRAAQRHPLHRQRARRLALQDQLRKLPLHTRAHRAAPRRSSSLTWYVISRCELCVGSRWFLFTNAFTTHWWPNAENRDVS